MWFFIALISTLLIMAGILALPLAKGRRRKVGLGTAASLIVAIVAMVISADDEAKRLGFTDAIDQRAAKDAGVTDAAAWHTAHGEISKAVEQEDTSKSRTKNPQAVSSIEDPFASAALRALHKLAVASAQLEQATKDSDQIGCQKASDSLQRDAHEVLVSMHQMPVAPIGAIEDISRLLRVSVMAQNGCTRAPEIELNLPMMVGQAIVGLRIDYAVGDADWYMVNTSNDVEVKNPIRYAQSLREQKYSWVDVRPKGVFFIGVSNWKAEMASSDVGDPAIENSGISLRAVEVDYRKNSSDDNAHVYFYRTRDEAEAATRVSKASAEIEAKAAAALKLSNADWKQKLTSLPYLIASPDGGFKLTYAVCKPAGKDAEGVNTCREDVSRDWSDSRAVPYHWFSDIKGCEDVAIRINSEHPPDVTMHDDDAFTSYCVPAPKVTGRNLKGYKMIFALTPPNAESDDSLYADLRNLGSRDSSVFKTFDACYEATNTAYSRTRKDLGVDEKSGHLLNDSTKFVDLTATCARVYN